MQSIETHRLILRNFHEDDSEALHDMIVQYQALEYAPYDQQWPTSAEEIKGITQWFASGDHFLAVCLKESGQFIGFVALNPEEAEDGPQYNLGYVFNSHFHGHGYATEACRAILDRVFGPLQASRVISGTAAVNRNSCRLLERLGFRKTSEAMVSFRTSGEGTPIEFLGCTYALSKEEWTTSKLTMGRYP